MEWDRKWKAFSGFTPRDLISVIMGFMSFPSRRPHTTSHVPGHTHTHTHTHYRPYISFTGSETNTHSTCVFVSPFLFSHSLRQPFTYFITHQTLKKADTQLEPPTHKHWHRKGNLSLSLIALAFCRESMRLGNEIMPLNFAKLIRCMKAITMTYPTA